MPRGVQDRLDDPVLPRSNLEDACVRVSITARQLSLLLEALSRMENWLRFPGLKQSRKTDYARRWQCAFERLARDARMVAELIDLKNESGMRA